MIIRGLNNVIVGDYEKIAAHFLVRASKSMLSGNPAILGNALRSEALRISPFGAGSLFQLHSLYDS